MSSPPKPAPTDAERELANLVQIGRRLGENDEGLKKNETYLKSEIRRHEAALVTADDAVAKLPHDAAPGDVFEAKRAVIAVEFNRDLLKEQLANLQPELDEAPKLIAANRKAVAAARTDLP